MKQIRNLQQFLGNVNFSPSPLHDRGDNFSTFVFFTLFVEIALILASKSLRENEQKMNAMGKASGRAE